MAAAGGAQPNSVKKGAPTSEERKLSVASKVKDTSADKLKKARIIFIIGGPGSGKGTQCDLIVQHYGFTHLSTGDLLREEVNSQSARAKQLKSIMDNGELVSLETVLQLLKEAMLKCVETSKGFLIDGFPREVEQGKRFEADVAPVEKVIYLQASDDTMKQRILKRGETSGRSDDNVETVVKRIQVFHSTIQPLLDFYTKRCKVFMINSEADGQSVFGQVVRALENKAKPSC